VVLGVQSPQGAGTDVGVVTRTPENFPIVAADYVQQVC